jgi:hypothetical protein
LCIASPAKKYPSPADARSADAQTLRHRAQPSQSLLQNIVADVRLFFPHEQHDDITLIIAKSSPAPL